MGNPYKTGFANFSRAHILSQQVTGSWVCDTGYNGIIANRNSNTTPLTQSHGGYSWQSTISGNSLHVGDGGAGGRFHINDPSLYSFGNGAVDFPFSLCIGIQFNNVTTYTSLFQKYGVPGPNGEYALYVVSNSIYCILYNTTGTAWIGRQTSAFLTVGSLIHSIVFTYTGNKNNSGIAIYDNAIRVDNANASSGVYPGQTPGNGTLGVGHPTNAVDFNLHYMHIYNRVLSYQEISMLNFDPYIFTRNKNINSDGFRPVSKTPSNFLALI